jgi:hypothetical protein
MRLENVLLKSLSKCNVVLQRRGIAPLLGHVVCGMMSTFSIVL